MTTNVDLEKLKGKSIFLATPMYGAQCSGFYTKSISDLTKLCEKYDIKLRLYFLFNESLITRARNYCADEFLRSDYTHMMFIDSDIGFDARDVLYLTQITNPEDGFDVTTGPYPKKTIAWEKVYRAMEMGFGKDNPFDLENFVGDFVFNPDKNIKTFKVSEPVPIREGGTGFMCIHRNTLEKYAEAYPELLYTPDHVRTENFDGSKKITAFFDTVIDEESNRYLSEDYMFSHYARRIGLNVWLCPWMRLKHVGSYTFGGSLAHIAAIQASPTATSQSNRKNFLTEKPLSDNIEKSNMNRKQRRALEKKGK